MFRFHLLTWFLFLALVSIEEVTAHSGYRHIYSLLGGATKRTDIHFMCKGKVCSVAVSAWAMWLYTLTWAGQLLAVGNHGLDPRNFSRIECQG